MWEKKEDLENIKEVVAEFKERLNAEVRQQKKLDIAEEKNFRRGELSEKYMAKMLYGWDNGKFEDKYLRKLERNWQRWKSVSLEEKPWKGGNVRIKNSRLYSFLIFFSFFIFILFWD